MRVVIVTGGTQGLGRVMTETLLADGHAVTALGRSGSGPLAQAERLLLAHGDVGNPDDCARVLEETIARFGRIDALINNAGVNLPVQVKSGDGQRQRTFYDVSVEQWQTLMRTNVDGAFYLARLVAPKLVEQGWGRIVNHVTSYRTMVRNGEHPYGPSKTALEAMVAIWSADLADTGVTVNAILPGGAADTRMIASDQVPDRSKLIPPSVVAGPISYLISDASNAMTGHRFIGALWKPGAPEEQNIAASSAVAGWPESVAASPAPAWPPN
jgi:NAD(P)-dependent dehydrogenase (short-subunit alcohol dehydrogenase family)